MTDGVISDLLPRYSLYKLCPQLTIKSSRGCSKRFLQNVIACVPLKPFPTANTITVANRKDVEFWERGNHERRHGKELGVSAVANDATTFTTRPRRHARDNSYAQT